MIEISEYTSPDARRTPGYPSGGPLFGRLVPPAAVLIISIMMFGFLSQVRNTSAATPTRSQADGLQTNPRHNTIAAFFAPEVHYWESRIVSWSEEWNLDPNLVATVMQIESCGDPKALSGSGAMGLFQVMPYHFIDNENPYKPKVNARRGLNYLKNALESGGGDLRLALAGYNGGITGAKRPESDWSAQMNRYVYWGTGIYQDAVNGGEQSDRLDEWLAAGGASLCRQAAKNIGDLR